MTPSKLTGILETAVIASSVIAGSLTILGLYTDNAKMSSLGTAGVAGCIYGYVKTKGVADRETCDEQLKAKQVDIDILTAQVEDLGVDNKRLLKLLQPYYVGDSLVDIETVRQTAETMRFELEAATRALTSAQQRADDNKLYSDMLSTEREKLIAELAGMQEVLKLRDESVKEWVAQFDQQNSEITRLETEINRLTVELAKHSEHKDLLVFQETHQTKERLKQAQEALAAMEQTAEQMGVDIVQYRNGLASVQETLDYLAGDGYGEIQQSHNEAVSALVAQVEQLTHQLQECQKPKLFGVPGEFSRADKLIDLMWGQGFAVDANEITPHNDGSFTVALNVRERDKLSQAYVDEMTKLGDFLATQCLCLEPFKFELDRINPFRVTTLVRYAAKPKATVKDISRLWRTAEQFVTTVSKWQRVRITGGSESGKSPLAELIVGAVLRTQADAQVRLAFPITNSRKNYWTLPITHTSTGALAGELKELCNRRGKGIDKSKHLVIGVLDEVDTALANDSSIATDIKEIIKTGSHTNVGVVLIGQNANVSNYKGLQRSDLENVVSVHIGANSYHAITNSDLSEEEQRRLKDRADKLTRYCEEQNADLDPDADSDKLTRFALVLEPNKAGYYIELPRFGSIPVAIATAPTIETQAVEPVTQGHCPHCLSTAYSKNGKTSDGQQRYKCKNSTCGKSFTLGATEHVLQGK